VKRNVEKRPAPRITCDFCRNRFRWTQDCQRYCWTGVRNALTIKARITSLPLLRRKAINRCGPARQCRSTSDPLQNGLESRSTFAGTYSDRHSFATLLKGNGEDVKTVQESLRHADSKVTPDTYTQELLPVKRAAQRRLIEAIGPLWTDASEMNAGSA
jgi:integrase